MILLYNSEQGWFVKVGGQYYRLQVFTLDDWLQQAHPVYDVQRRLTGQPPISPPLAASELYDESIRRLFR